MQPRLIAPALTLALAALLVAGCGSSSKDSSSSDTTTPTTASSEECPFDGTTALKTEPGAGTATKLESGTSERSGCIDQFTLAFTPTVAQASAEYPGAEATLEITLANTTYSGPSEPSADSLEYVESISVETAGDDTIVTLTLDKQRPFLLSTSEVPAELQISIG